MKGVEQPPQYHPEGDVWTHTLLMLDAAGGGRTETLAWGVLLHDVGKPPTFRSVAETGDRIRFGRACKRRGAHGRGDLPAGSGSRMKKRSKFSR